jgi:hypothetical protein
VRDDVGAVRIGKAGFAQIEGGEGSAMAGKPMWRQAFDVVERSLAPRLEALVQTSGFADALAVGVQIEATFRRRAERQTRRLWHAANLPAGSDVTRLREQVVGLDRQLREVIATLEEAQKEWPHAQPLDPSGADRRGRTGPPRGPAQRPARS